MVHIFKSLFAALWASGAIAHSERDLSQVELQAREVEMENTRRALDFCFKKMEASGISKRHLELRAKRAHQLRAVRGIMHKTWKRDLDSEFTPDAPHTAIFGSRQSACVLASDTTAGPFYIDGEFIRDDIVEGQQGVELFVDLIIVDVATCSPIPNIYVDFWQANSTGVYSGVVNQGNGNPADRSNLNNTFGRGIYASDKDGIIEFRTLFPGHYKGRAVHIHLATHQEGQVLPNNTFKSTRASYVGQIYFDQNLINQVERLAPYTDNLQKLTPNSQDVFLQDQLRKSHWSPVVQTRLLGSTVEEGVYAWITVAINTTASYSIPAAVHWTKNGGVPASNRVQSRSNFASSIFARLNKMR
ncbi:hypothetical protein PRK78_005431 [Emydomyces testavorans]|uniref:Intradiol ring-cleavage dioxygenases domain-containing protein n=1 Tax=Emydomyces testavorans TaxID=2070801 RepID=A0AAF0DJJ1_9EURO|nr:hypothetical protein PRK78_005431 [Emydomyces testavorans]